MSVKAMKQRLEELEKIHGDPMLWRSRRSKINFLRQAIAEEEKREPKREWVPLTDEEYEAIRNGLNAKGECNVRYGLFDEGEYGCEVEIYVDDFYCAIEAKLREKNT